MKKITADGTIKGGVLRISFRDRFVNSLQSLSDGRVKITIERIYRKRSLYQNAYYWGVIVQCFLDGVKTEWGEEHSPDWAHEQLKNHCNYTEKSVRDTGELVRLPQSTKELTTAEFAEYEDRCCKLIAEWFGIAVPEPGEQLNLC
jgi:hypothetical protein